METDQDNSLYKFTMILQSIASGNPEEVTQGWRSLQLLENNLSNPPDNYVDVLTKFQRVLLQGQVKNMQEIPKLLEWFAKHLKNGPDLDSNLNDDLAIFIENSDLQDISVLKSILKVVSDYQIIYLYRSTNHKKLCKAIVNCLARCSMPRCPVEIKEYNENLREIQKYLTPLNDKNILNFCLEELYKIISDTRRSEIPGCALCIILLLVEKNLIKEGVCSLLSSSYKDPELIQALIVISNWLTINRLENEHLAEWLQAFIDGLETNGKYNILMKVAETTLSLNNVSSVFLFPKVSKSVGNIFLYMLKRQNNPTVFHKFINLIEKHTNSFKSQQPKYTAECLQNMVEVIQALMIRFNISENEREKIQIKFPVKPREDVVTKIVNERIWNEENKLQISCLSEKNRINIVSSDSIRNVDNKVGLANLGNTCYMNSVLQALAMTRQFKHEVLHYKVNDLNSQVLLSKLQKLFALLTCSKRNSLSPTEIFQVSRPAYFMPGQQQDSSEFLCHLLDVLYEQEKSSITINGSTEMMVDMKPSSDEPMDDSMGDEPAMKSWATTDDLTEGAALQRKTQSLADFTQGEDLAQSQQLSDNHSDSTDSGIQSVGGEDVGTPPSILVHRVFGGESKITYQCQQCDNSSDNTDKFRDLQLCFPEDIPETEISVQDLIKYYLTPEELTGDNKYRCEKCMNLCDAQRIIKILQAPAHLILTLKHFRYDSESRLRTKLRHKVAYDETINLPVIDSSPETYRLYAAVVHSGYSMDYGHYFTYACDSKQKWYKFNDSYISSTTLEEFKKLEPPDTPYILFYEKFTSVGAFEEDKQELIKLSKHLQDIVEKDKKSFFNESQYREDRKRNSFSPNHHDNSDDDNPPSSTCRGAIKIQSTNCFY